MHGRMKATALLNWMQMLIENENIASLFGTVRNSVYGMTTGVLFGTEARNAVKAWTEV